VQKQSLTTGVIASVMVPFAPDGEIDADQLRAEVKLLDESPVDGLCAGGLLSGTAGAPAEELYALCAGIRRASRKPLFAMVFPDITVEALEMVRAVAEAGAEAILVAQPHYLCQPGESGLVDMFAELKRAVSCPLLLADCFPEAKVDLKTTSNLINSRLIDGVLQSADVHSLVDLLCSHPGVPVYSGIEDLHYVALMLGARGTISDLAAVFPRDLSELYRSSQSGKHQEARLYHERLVRLWHVLSLGPEREARVRSALTAQGRKVGSAPSPYGELRVEVAREIADTLHREGLTVAGSA
jgi:dihydrodipicolinate synthase/N-acetylneuraminate lyase